LCLLALSLAAAAQKPEQVVHWTAKPSAAGPLKPGQAFTAQLALTLEEGWHIYSIAQAPPPIHTTVTVPDGQPVRLNGPVTGSKPTVALDENFGVNAETYERSATLRVPLVVAAGAPAGEQTVRLELRFQACNNRLCLPPKKLPVEMKLVFAAASAAAPAPKPEPAAPKPAPEPAPPPAAAPRDQSFGAFLWLAFVMGALSLLTPCVFPMIPITVSYFTSHSAHSRRAALCSALLYALGIILTFTALGMALALVFGAGGVNQLAANPWVNLLITAIFVIFAFGLFGAFLLQVPPALVQRIDDFTRSKGSTNSIGVLLMGLTFTLTSFTCTAPFVGTLLVMASQGNWRWPMAGMLVFSSVFAAPFFVLALLPQLLTQLPKSGGWLNSVKVVMGLLEIAAAMKFLSNADLVWHWNIFTRPVVLSVWVAIGILTVVYLLGRFRMPHDSPVDSVGALRLTFAIVFLATTVWLLTGLFGRPLGEIESFLPPATESAASPTTSPAHGDWILNDYPAALARAQASGRPVFVDFTGYTCTNCRWMEVNMFPRPEVRRELEKFVLVRLYTDGSGDLFERQQKMQNERFSTVALPFYAVLRPTGETIATFPGLTRDPAEFVRFLSAAAAR
jgi:thiol:disulfide interchange protein DsbD